MDVKLSDLIGNYERPTDRPTDLLEREKERETD